MKKLRVVGIDIAKQLFHLVGMDEHGTILVRKRLYRAQLMVLIAQLPPTLIAMEACGGAHDWARRFREHGHEVQLMAPQCVKPYVKTHTNDIRLLDDLARDLNPDRPGRVEPRVVKRRPKPFPWLQQPRSMLREALLQA